MQTDSKKHEPPTDANNVLAAAQIEKEIQKLEVQRFADAICFLFFRSDNSKAVINFYEKREKQAVAKIAEMKAKLGYR